MRTRHVKTLFLCGYNNTSALPSELLSQHFLMLTAVWCQELKERIATIGCAHAVSAANAITVGMSDLESEAAPIITALITKARDLADLTFKGKATLARWAAKTAYTLDSAAHPSIRSVPVAHRWWIAKHVAALPDRVGVFAHQYSPRGTTDVRKAPVLFTHGAIWTFLNGDTSPAGPISDAQENYILTHSYKVTLMVSRLMLCVAYCGDSTVDFAPLFPVQKPVWPPMVVSPYINAAHLSDESVSAFEAVRRFHRSLGLSFPLRHGRLAPRTREHAALENRYFRPTLLSATGGPFA